VHGAYDRGVANGLLLDKLWAQSAESALFEIFGRNISAAKEKTGPRRIRQWQGRWSHLGEIDFELQTWGATRNCDARNRALAASVP
jgi:hypothetical protein